MSASACFPAQSIHWIVSRSGVVVNSVVYGAYDWERILVDAVIGVVLVVATS